MSEPFIGEIRMFGFNWPPMDWAKCDGQLLSIGQFSTLYALLGTQFGGDGVQTFGVPDLRGRVAFGACGGSYRQGQTGGAEAVTLTQASLPAHTHDINASSAAANAVTPAGNFFSAIPQPPRGSRYMYGMAASSMNSMNPAAVGSSGGSGMHNNLQPYLAVNFCIALAGIWPNRD